MTFLDPQHFKNPPQVTWELAKFPTETVLGQTSCWPFGRPPSGGDLAFKFAGREDLFYTGSTGSSKTVAVIDQSFPRANKMLRSVLPKC